MNRNMLVLGVVALLAIGGVAIFLASKNGGNVFKIFQNTTTQIINNSYFTQLIADEVTTREDLESIAEIRPYGEGFIGVSKGALDWTQAQEFAERTGAQILAVDEAAIESREDLLTWLGSMFKSHVSSPTWVLDQNEAGVLAGSEILAVKTTEGERKVLLQWRTLDHDLAGAILDLSEWKVLSGKWTDEEGGMSGTGGKNPVLMSGIHGSNFEYSADITLKTDLPSGGSLIFRSKNRDFEQCYVANITTEEGGTVKLFKIPYKVLGIYHPSIKVGKTYHLKVVASANNIKVHFEDGDKPVIEVNDPSHHEGWFGLLSWKGGAVYKDVRVKQL